MMSAHAIPVMIDKAAHRKMRNRAFAHAKTHDFLFNAAMAQLAERLCDTTYIFSHALILDGYGGLMQQHLAKNGLLGTKIKKITETDCAANFATAAKNHGDGMVVIADCDALPFAPQSFDLVLSPFHLHWANDLVGALIQIRQLLKPDGAFFGVLPAGKSFADLRRIIAETEIAMRDGASPHILPFAQSRQLSDLMQRAGFAAPIIDSQMLDIHYQDPQKIWQDLRDMGEGNALMGRSRTIMPRNFFPAVNDRLQKTAHQDSITLTIELAFLHGWTPA